jgi:protoporphyrinogen IX oxidase
MNSIVLYLKAIHIIFVVTWFSGLFYIVRLFIYHTETLQKPEPEKSILQSQFKVMEKRLWYFIAVPSMYLTVASGLWLAWDFLPDLGNYPWLLLKLAFVFGLVLYHIQCGVILRQLHSNRFKYSSFQLRLWNEGATLFLVAIVFIIVLKNMFDWIWGMGGLLLLGSCLWVAASWYKAAREKKADNQQ